MAGMDRSEEMSQSTAIGRKRSIAMTEDGESGDYCRICRGESTPEQPLFHPCKCSGSIKYVHQECLMEWLSHSQKKYCELCKTSFRFTKLYDRSMPDRLPLPLFLHQLTLHGGRRLARGLRYVLVVFVWFCWLPWSIRQVWRGLFWLADGSWMTAQELQQFVTENAVAQNQSSTVNAVINDTVGAVAMGIDSQLEVMAPFGFIGTIVNLLSGDALLRGLLRLIAHKASSPTPDISNLNITSSVSTPLLSGKRRSSVLADVQSLNSFTKYPVLNNALMDLLEGQLVCLAVITAFILVFLIREWVVNQQPVHHMPDPDQAEAPAAPANQDNARQDGGRRRRGAFRPPQQNGDLHMVPRPLDIANRPRVIPRPRRAITDDNIGVAQNTSAGPVAPHLPPRADSLQNLSTDSFHSNDSALPDDAAFSEDIHPPPLQRGIFDEVVDIRRNIEEHANLNPRDRNNDSGSDPSIFTSPITPGGSDQSPNIEEANPDPHNESRGSPWADIGNSSQADSRALIDTALGTPDTEVIQPSDEYTGHDADADADAVWENMTEVATETTDVDTASNHNDRPNQGMSQTPSLTMNVEPVVNEPVVAPQGLIEGFVLWLWDTDQYRLQHTPAPAVATGQAREDNAPAHFVPVIAAPVLQQPAVPPAPVPGPEIPWGVDINEPNGMDDLEDVEGILELIGMEGPIAGMFQNFVFSIFLISMTLTASVWCPYIWGKISLLIMSSPISVFFKAPLYFTSNVADILIDVMLLLIGLMGYGMTNITKMLKVLVSSYLPGSSRFLQFQVLEDLALNVTQRSSNRLEKALSVTVFHLRPDLPTFSMQSHHALRVFKKAILEAVTAISFDILDTIKVGEQLWQSNGLLAAPLLVLNEVSSLPGATISAFAKCTAWLKVLSNDLRMPPMDDPDNIDYSLSEWGAKDRVLAVIAGYFFFVLVACAYLQVAHRVYGLRSDEKVGGVFADSLRQAGGVVKVIVIIGIEMIVFPLYCGCLLDIALLPLFKDMTISTRVSFVFNAPVTGMFVHWFLGTCYMFHFALFVSMCRKILRKGVLYFIRDPDDPTFHPVRDVLERAVTSQLSKIAFSAGVYGGLVIFCLGSVVWTLSKIGGVFPIQWTTSEPHLAFPVDIITFNFIMPFIAKRAEPSKRISAVYEWWFRSCARKLKLSHFLFNEEREEEMNRTAATPQGLTSTMKSGHDLPFLSDKDRGSERPIVADGESTPSIDGYWVRAPAADSVRIPKGTKVFLEVDENNNRVDGLADREKGLHGKSDERFARIFVPSNFRLRICMFVFLVWLFAASTGATFTIGPLLLGRSIIHLMSGTGKAPNDLYAITVGMHICAATAYMILIVKRQQQLLKTNGLDMLLNVKENMIRLYQAVKYTSGLLYVAITFGIVIPMLLSLLAEVYIHMPIYTYVTSSIMLPSSEVKPATTTEFTKIGSIPTIYLIQAWTLGILYLRIFLRIVMTYPSSNTRAATAIKAIVRNGILHPDIRLATRAFILPVITVTLLLLVLPLFLAKVFILMSNTTNDTASVKMYRRSYPTLLIVALTSYFLMRIYGNVEGWQIKVRDEVYLVGERLHNFSDPPPTKPKHYKANISKDQLFKSQERDEEVVLEPLEQENRSEMQAQETDTTSAKAEPFELDLGEASSSTPQ